MRSSAGDTGSFVSVNSGTSSFKIAVIVSGAESRWKTGADGAREALWRAGTRAHAVLLAGEWTWLRVLKWTATLLVGLIAAAVI